MKYTTLNKIRACSPCEAGWYELLKHLNKTKSDDEPLAFEVILESNGLSDALWCTRSAPEYDREWRLFAVWCARQVQHFNPAKEVGTAIKVAEDYANGRATTSQLDAARDAARDAAQNATGTALFPAWAAVGAAGAKGVTAYNTARDAVAAAATAATALDTALDTAGGTAWSTAWDAAWDAQTKVFLWVVNGGLSDFEKERIQNDWPQGTKGALK